MLKEIKKVQVGISQLNQPHPISSPLILIPGPLLLPLLPISAYASVSFPSPFLLHFGPFTVSSPPSPPLSSFLYSRPHTCPAKLLKPTVFQLQLLFLPNLSDCSHLHTLLAPALPLPHACVPSAAPSLSSVSPHSCPTFLQFPGQTRLSKPPFRPGGRSSNPSAPTHSPCLKCLL